MPRPPAKKTLRFPFAGVARRKNYREQTNPYASPAAVNVRGKDHAGRELGGSRPGLAKVVSNAFGAITAMGTVASINSAGTRNYDLIIIGGGSFHRIRGSVVATSNATLRTDTTNLAILAEDGQEIVFAGEVAAASPVGSTGAYTMTERNGKLYLADSVLREYDPQTGVVQNIEGAPAGQPLVRIYRDRVILTGKDHLWYASRQGDPTDWAFAADIGDKGRAVAGQLSLAGRIGNVPLAVVPVDDRALVFACANSLWVLRGDPADGQLDVVSEEIGIVGTEAWAKSPDGLMAFLSNDGIYIWTAGSNERPARFSEERLPNELRNADATRRITMAYDPVGRGFHLSSTPVAGNGFHWWLDIDAKAMWPVVYGNADHQPVAVSRLEGTGLAEIVLGGRDGYVRKFLAAASTDDGTALTSHVLVGPLLLAPDDTRDAVFNEIHGMLREGAATWRVFTGPTAESAVATAITAINALVAGTTPVGVKAGGAWVAGRNKVERARARGPWVVVMVSGTGIWVYEAVAITALQLGRIR